MTHPETLTDLLSALERGDSTAYGRAFALVYDELRAVAHAQRRRWRDESLETTTLVHETFVKLAGADGLALENRSHFLAVAARAMRQLLCNHARDRRRLKRGGGLRRTDRQPDDIVADVSDTDLDTIIALDDALVRLEREQQRLARVVECRFFAGLSISDTADALGTSPATVKRDWATARSWLYQSIEGGREAGDRAD